MVGKEEKGKKGGSDNTNRGVRKGLTLFFAVREFNNKELNKTN